MRIAYCYPNKHLIRRLRRLGYVSADFEFSEVEHICDLLTRMHERFGDKMFTDLPNVFKTGSIALPALPNNLKAWQSFLTEKYIPREPSVLSPGAMANPPDRLDGFHTYNTHLRSLQCSGPAARPPS